MIERRLENLLALDYPADRLEIVVTSDASTDRTRRARRGGRGPRATRAADPLPARRQGRGAGPRRARDRRRDRRLLGRERDLGARRAAQARRARSPIRRSRTSAAGSCSTDAAGSNREGVYWRYETWLRAQESALGSVTGGNGSIYAVRRSDYVEVDPRFGHDLSLPYLMVQRGRRAVYDPEALAFEKPTPEIETEYRRKVRMFEHCWLIVLRGQMLRRLPAGLPRRDRLPPPPPLRQRPAAPGRCSATNVALVALRRAASTTCCSAASSRSSCSRRVAARAAALLRARHLGDGRLALELPAPRRARDLGPGRRDAVTGEASTSTSARR